MTSLVVFPRETAPFIRLIRAAFDKTVEDQSAGHETLCVCGHTLASHDPFGGGCQYCPNCPGFIDDGRVKER